MTADTNHSAILKKKFKNYHISAMV